MKIILLFICVASFGCTSTLKVVDPTGQPIEGAVVLTQKQPYIMQKWKIGASVTDESGIAPIVDDIGYIFKKGYYPFIEKNEIKNDYYTSNYMGSYHLNSKITLYPIKAPNNYEVSISEKEFLYNNKTEIQILDIYTCDDVKVEHDFFKNTYTIYSPKNNLLESKRFFFEGPYNMEAKNKITGKGEIYFYCNSNNNQLYKVGIGTNNFVSYSGQSTHGIVVLRSKIEDIKTVIEPAIKNIAKENTYLYDNENMTPEVVMNTTLHKLETELENNLPVREENDRLFKQDWLTLIKKHVKANNAINSTR